MMRISSSWTTLLSVDLSASASLSLNLHLEHGIGHAFGVPVAHFGSVSHSRTGRSTWHRLFFVVTASGADDDVLADSDDSEFLTAGSHGRCLQLLCVRLRWQVGAVRLGLDQLGVHDGAASPPPSKAGVRQSCNSSSGTPRCVRTLRAVACDVIEYYLKRPTLPHRPPTPPSPVSCGTSQIRWCAFSGAFNSASIVSQTGAFACTTRRCRRPAPGDHRWAAAASGRTRRCCRARGSRRRTDSCPPGPSGSPTR